MSKIWLKKKDTEGRFSGIKGQVLLKIALQNDYLIK